MTKLELQEITNAVLAELDRIDYPPISLEDMGKVGIAFPGIEINWEYFRSIPDGIAENLPDTHFNATYDRLDNFWIIPYPKEHKTFEGCTLIDAIGGLIDFLKTDRVIKYIGKLAVTMPRRVK